MKRLEHLLKKTTPYSPKQYCELHDKNVSDYTQIHVCYLWLNKLEQQMFEELFTKHPDAEMLSNFSKKQYKEQRTYYRGILLVPKTQTYRVHANGRKH